MIESINSETFKEGDKFKVYYGENQFVEIDLIKIKMSKYQYPNATRDSFSLLFTSDVEVFINSGTYQVEQERVGIFDLGLSPTIPYDQQFHYYEAVFA